jgi:hypothetical protein
VNTQHTSFVFNEDMYNDVMAYMSASLEWTIKRMDKDKGWNADPEFKEQAIKDALDGVIAEATFLGAAAALCGWKGPEKRVEGGKLHSGNFSEGDRIQMALLKADIIEQFPELPKDKANGAGAVAFYCGWTK